MKRSALVVLLGCLVAAGCRLPGASVAGDAPSAVELCDAELPASQPGEAVQLTYATEADRLNVASGGVALPAASRCLLRVESPHPAGKPGLARVTLVVAPQPTEVGWWARRFGKSAPAVVPSEVRVLDIPEGEAQSLLATLDRERFYVRAKPLTTDALVGVNRNGERFAKDFRSLPQFDALVLRAHQQGAGSGQRAGGVELATRKPAGEPEDPELPASEFIASQCRLLPPVANNPLR